MMTPSPGGFYDLAVTHVHPHMQQQHQQQQQHQHVSHLATESHHHNQQIQHQHQHQHQQHQQHMVVSPMNVYDDWSSLAGTVVDESVFASVMGLGWQADMTGHRGAGG
jgi:hypothetical protein